MNISDRLYVDGEVLDFEGSYNVTFEANDYLNWKPGTAFKSERLTIYNTPKNRRLLSNIFHLNSATSNEFEAVYISKYVTMQGILKVLQVNRIKAEAVFYSGNGLLWDDLKGLKLNEIDCSEYNHTLNVTAVTDSETYNAANFYMYDFCDRGTPIETGYVHLIERFPAINLRLLLTKIFNGYTLSGDLIDEDWFKRLFLMFTASNQIRNSEEWKTTALFFAGKTASENLALSVYTSPNEFILLKTIVVFVDTGLTGAFDNGGNFATNKFTAPEAGTYRLKAELNATLALGAEAGNITGTVTFTFYKNTTVLLCENEYNLPNQISHSIANRYLDTGFIELSVGDTVAVYAEVAGTYDGTMGGVNLAVSSVSTFENEVSRYYGTGSTVVIANTLPDISVLEFLNDLFIYFGLYPFYNIEGRRVILHQLKTTSTVNDISDQIESRNGVEFQTVENMNYKLMFAEDKTDKFLQLAIENDYITDGSYEQDNGAKETTEIILKHLSKTFFQYYATYGYQIPRFWGDVKGEKFTTKFNPRILYYSGAGSVDYNLKHGVESFSTETERHTIPLFTDLTTSINLNFEDRATVTGMWQYNRRVFDMLANGKPATVTVKLNSNDIANFYTCNGKDLRTPVYVNNEYISGRFLILKAKQKNDNVFDLELIQIFD